MTLPARTPDHVIEARLSGPGHHYTWPFDGRLYDPTPDGIGVKPEQRVRMRMINESTMFHPIHLHGHTFEVVRRDGPRAGKGTVLVPPRQTVEVDFDTVNPGSGSPTATTPTTSKAAWAAGSSTRVEALPQKCA